MPHIIFRVALCLFGTPYTDASSSVKLNIAFAKVAFNLRKDSSCLHQLNATLEHSHNVYMYTQFHLMRCSDSASHRAAICVMATGNQRKHLQMIRTRSFL